MSGQDKTVHELALHEQLAIAISASSTTIVTRVPGGWVYTCSHNYNPQVTSTFVPYSKEFSKPTGEKREPPPTTEYYRG